MPHSIQDLADLTAAAAASLQDLGVSSTEQLLLHTGTSAERSALAERIGASAQQVLAWANEADLMRIPGVGTSSTQLLEAAGVTGLGELAARNAEQLSARMAEVNAELGLTHGVPATGEVAAWIEAARQKLPLVGP